MSYFICVRHARQATVSHQAGDNFFDLTTLRESKEKSEAEAFAADQLIGVFISSNTPVIGTVEVELSIKGYGGDWKIS